MTVINDNKCNKNSNANTSYEAQRLASTQFKAKKSYEVSVYLCEKHGEQVITTLTN